MKVWWITWCICKVVEIFMSHENHWNCAVELHVGLCVCAEWRREERLMMRGSGRMRKGRRGMVGEPLTTRLPKTKVLLASARRNTATPGSGTGWGTRRLWRGEKDRSVEGIISATLSFCVATCVQDNKCVRWSVWYAGFFSNDTTFATCGVNCCLVIRQPSSDENTHFNFLCIKAKVLANVG